MKIDNKKHSLITGLLITGLILFCSPPCSLMAAGTKDNPCTNANWFDPAICLNGVSGAVTSVDSLRLALPTNRKLAKEKEEDRTAGIYVITGLSAGDSIYGLSGWGNYSRSEFESTFSQASFEANIDSFMIGSDMILGNNSVVGMAVAYENLSSTTYYNGGGDSQDALMLVPYFGMNLSDTLIFDFLVGYGWLDHDQTRVDTGNGGRLIATYDSNRIIAATNLTNSYEYGNNILTARLGIGYAEETHDGYIETPTVLAGTHARTVLDRKIKLLTGELGLGYSRVINNITPYAEFIFRKDFDYEEDTRAGGLPGGTIAHPDDVTETEMLLGLNVVTQAYTLQAEFNKLYSRDYADRWGMRLDFRVPF